MVQFNDYIIRKQLTKGEPEIANKVEENIKIFLNVLESVEVLFEITSKKVFGNKRKFIVIFIIQAVKYETKFIHI